MGADLILATLELPDIEKFDPEEWYLLFSAYLNTKSEDKVNMLIEEMAFWSDYDNNYDAIRVAIEDTLLHDTRDKGFYNINDRWVVITGGMSWGDSPSDSYEFVNLVQMLVDY